MSVSVRSWSSVRWSPAERAVRAEAVSELKIAWPFSAVTRAQSSTMPSGLGSRLTRLSSSAWRCRMFMVSGQRDSRSRRAFAVNCAQVRPSASWRSSSSNMGASGDGTARTSSMMRCA